MLIDILHVIAVYKSTFILITLTFLYEQFYNFCCYIIKLNKKKKLKKRIHKALINQFVFLFSLGLPFEANYQFINKTIIIIIIFKRNNKIKQKISMSKMLCSTNFNINGELIIDHYVLCIVCIIRMHACTYVCLKHYLYFTVIK